MIKFKDDLFSPILYSKSNTELSEEQSRKYKIDVELLNPSSEVINTNAVFIAGDTNTSIITATVKYNNKIFNLKDYSISINVKEGSSITETFICEDIDIDIVNGIVNINIPTPLVDEPGHNEFEMVFQKTGSILISQMYSYLVLPSLGEGYIGDEVIELTALQSLIKQVQVQENNIKLITSDLEFSSKDIDDIINMIG